MKLPGFDPSRPAVTYRCAHGSFVCQPRGEPPYPDPALDKLWCANGCGLMELLPGAEVQLELGVDESF